MAHRGDGLNDIFDENVTVRKKLIANQVEAETSETFALKSEILWGVDGTANYIFPKYDRDIYSNIVFGLTGFGVGGDTIDPLFVSDGAGGLKLGVGQTGDVTNLEVNDLTTQGDIMDAGNLTVEGDIIAGDGLLAGSGTSGTAIHLDLTDSGGYSIPANYNANAVALCVSRMNNVCGINVLSSSSLHGNIYFGDGSSYLSGILRYDHNTDQMQVYCRENLIFNCNYLSDFTFGRGNIANDVDLTFNTSGNDGVLHWENTNDRFKFDDKVYVDEDLTTTKFLKVGIYSDATRGSAGTAGRIIFNTTDGNINIDDGTNWILPDGTTT